MPPGFTPVHASKRLEPAATIFLASVLGLFLELALIRWVSCEIRIFAYLKNMVLVASFLGFGAGCLLSRKRPFLVASASLLLLLCMVIRLPWQSLAEHGPRRVSHVLAEIPGFVMFWGWAMDQMMGVVSGLLFGLGWTTGIFFVIAIIMMPFGQLTAAAMSRMEDPLRAYSINVAGSLVGILLYTVATRVSLPPLLWFVPVLLGAIPLAARRAQASFLLVLSAASLLVLLPDDSPTRQDFWSPYQKLTVTGNNITVNNVGYQEMHDQSKVVPGQPETHTRWSLPYRLGRPTQSVLILGAGSGNDAAAALAAGVPRVTAVDIDPVIFAIGEQLHPNKPYEDERVHRVVDDARHFLKTTQEKFDLVVMSHLDSHTVLSSFTNVRLDDYIYTTDSFAEVRKVMTEDGVLFLSFWAQEPFIAERLHKNLALAFGHPPAAFRQTDTPPRGAMVQAVFLAAQPEVQAVLAASAVQTMPLVPILPDVSTIEPSTDSWPFLPLRGRSVPYVMVLVGLAILLVSGGLAWRIRPRGERADVNLFFLGAAFMLLETHNVSRLALVFGTTWHVNAWVIGAILGVILLANLTCARMRSRGGLPRGVAGSGLFLSLAVAFLVPIAVFVDHPWLAVVVLTAPIYFAGLVFADAFARSPAPGFALGWNVLGSVVGGLVESLSYVVGIPGMVPVAAVFYALALAWPTAKRSG